MTGREEKEGRKTKRKSGDVLSIMERFHEYSGE